MRNHLGAHKALKPEPKPKRRKRRPRKQTHKDYFGHVERTYGLTQERYMAMLEAQGGACRVCKERFTKRPNVDHCHGTGRVRSLLCSRCNGALGQAQDSVDRLLRLAAYLDEHAPAPPILKRERSLFADDCLAVFTTKA